MTWSALLTVSQEKPEIHLIECGDDGQNRSVFHVSDLNAQKMRELIPDAVSLKGILKLPNGYAAITFDRTIYTLGGSLSDEQCQSLRQLVDAMVSTSTTP